MKQEIAMLVILFFCYSVAGWCMEVILKFIQFGRFINRGFLIGPYCPIYGAGAVAVTVLVGGTIGSEAGYIITFVSSFVLCGALEYFVSWYMEKMFHARWWDYSQLPCNLNGRIWIGNLILFGLGGVAIVKWIDPPLIRLIYRCPDWLLYTLAVCIAVLIVSDNVASHLAFNLVKKEIDGVDADNSEEISTKVRQLLREDPILLRRIGEAYPNLTVKRKQIVEKIKEKAELVQESVDEKRQEFEEKKQAVVQDLEEKRQAVAQNLEEKRQAAERRSEKKNKN